MNPIAPVVVSEEESMIIPSRVRKAIPAPMRKRIRKVITKTKHIRMAGLRYAKLEHTQRPYISPRERRITLEKWDKLIATPPVPLDEYAAGIEPLDIEEFTSCMFCGTKDVQPLFMPKGVGRDGTKWRYYVVRCPSCGHLRRNPNVIPERLGELYAVKYSEFLSDRYARTRQRKYRLTMNAWSPWLDDGTGKRLLDFGCGNGLFLEVAHERGFETYGVDLSPDSIEQARQRPGGANAYFGSPMDVPEIAKGGFDVITMWSVLAHLPSPIEDLSMLRSLLAPGGVLFIWTVNANSLLLKRYGPRWNGFTRNHLMFYSRETAPLLMEAAGFHHTEFRPYYTDGIEIGSAKLPLDYQQRIRDFEDQYGGSNMMRVAALTSEVPFQP